MAKSRKEFIKENNISTRQGRDTFRDLQEQCRREYEIAYSNQKAKKTEQEVRLTLYNNQMRQKEYVGDPEMFTVHQTLLAVLYIDKLNAQFEGREEGDNETADNLNAMAEYDYDEMQKDRLDYFWDWDASFFGRGYVDMSEFKRDPDTKIYLPLPHNIDPIPFLRDPWAVSVNGDVSGVGAALFLGFEIQMTRNEMENDPHIFDDVNFRQIKTGSAFDGLLSHVKNQRAIAQGRAGTSETELLGENTQYTITKWFTHMRINGKVKKVKVYLANDREKVVGIEVLSRDYWPIQDRTIYPMSHDWDGVSVADLTEDKQRMRGMFKNLMIKAAKLDVLPRYMFDSAKIVNRKDLDPKFNKHIPIDTKGMGSILDAIAPIRKDSPNLNMLLAILNFLDTDSQRSTSATSLAQGVVSDKNRTATEINKMAGGTQSRNSLASRIFGWSERDFWGRHWYHSYKDNFAEVDEKVVRLTGSFGPMWRKLTKENITANLDPDVKVESSEIVRAKQFEERTLQGNYFSLAFQEPSANRRYGLKKLGRLNGLKKDEIDRLLPMTIDEREAEEENEKLNKNEYVKVLAEQDHNTHLEVHSKLASTAVTRAHMKNHETALLVKRSRPELFPSAKQMENTEQNPQGSTKMTPVINRLQASPPQIA